VRRAGSLVVAAIVAAAPPESFGQTVRRGLDDYTVTTWNENDGLSASHVTALAQDRDGYLWIGTDVGLVRFDGVRFERFARLGDTQLPFGVVSTLLSAKDRSLWIGLGGPGVTRMRDGTFVSYAARDGIDGAPYSLLEDRDGIIWAGTSRGLFRFDGQRWQAAGLGDRAVVALHQDRLGRIWVAAREAVLRRETPGDRFEPVHDIELSSNIWQAFSEDSSGGVWISDFREGFRRIDAAAVASPRSGWGVRLLHDRRANLWVATRGQGLWRVREPARGNPVPEVLTMADGLASNAVQSVFEDAEGNIWVGTYAGLQRLTPRRVTPVNDLPIARATVSTPDGRVWIGTTTGLIQAAPGVRRQYQEAQGLPGRVVLASSSDARGRLWVATERALARFSDGRFSTVVTVPSDRRIFSIAVSDGTVWVRDVLFRLQRFSEDGAPVEMDGVPDAFRTAAVSLSADRAGRLWIGSDGGRLGVRDPGGAFRTFDLGIGITWAIFEDASGTMWFGGDNGLASLQGGRIVTISAANGLPSGVYSIVEDEEQILWVGLRSGIARLEKAGVAKAAASPGHQLQFRLFTSADGVAGVAVAEGSPTAVRARDGRLWFATSGGATVIHPRHVGEPRPAVRAHVEAIVADTRHLDPVADLELPPRTSHVQFVFTARTLTDSVRVQFRYRLDGQDRDWVDAGTTRQASYTNLSPGRYRFLLRGTSGDGSWSDPAVLAFTVRPAFYQTAWFQGLTLLAFMAVIGTVWWRHERRVRGQFALVLAERIRMSRAIHDTLLQGLAGLALQLDDLSHGADAPPTTRDRVRRIRRQVEDHIREARQSILDLRSPALDARPLADAIRAAGLRAVNGRPVAFTFEAHGTPRPCSAAVEEQLLYVCQEAVTNAVRHGRPTTVRVGLEYDDEVVRVEVRDDGCGFDPAGLTQADGHCGVSSMQERAAQVHGRLTITSSPGRGTQVELVAPPA
jgi:signal transduction histidine kinase/ligand-binding sensor domain-containing protein